MGCDFSSSPSKRKPIVVAVGRMHRGTVQLDRLHHIQTLSEFLEFLKQPTTDKVHCVAGFDLPFGLPRAFVEHMKANKQVVFEVQADAEKEWGHHINERVKETLYLSTDSYYNGAEVKGKPRVFMPYSGGVRGYRRI